MTEKYPLIPSHLVKALEDKTIPLIDLMHGHLKVEMLDCEEMMKDNPDRFLQGYMEGLVNMYTMTYNLSIERAQLEKEEQDPECTRCGDPVYIDYICEGYDMVCRDCCKCGCNP
jgi:hypothetical protein